MSYSEIIVRCETDPLFFLGCVCWAAFAVGTVKDYAQICLQAPAE